VDSVRVEAVGLIFDIANFDQAISDTKPFISADGVSGDGALAVPVTKPTKYGNRRRSV
jgi:hypothetical protein